MARSSRGELGEFDPGESFLATKRTTRSIQSRRARSGCHPAPSINLRLQSRGISQGRNHQRTIGEALGGVVIDVGGLQGTLGSLAQHEILVIIRPRHLSRGYTSKNAEVCYDRSSINPVKARRMFMATSFGTREFIA